jgi:hypothetical protein
VPLTPWTHRSGSSLSSRAQAGLDRGKEIPAAAPESFMILACTPRLDPYKMKLCMCCSHIQP